ncbi:MAG: protein kinase [Planctomycetes bacterium]|nr:protein kinase [Planctomycetota bacterium]
MATLHIIAGQDAGCKFELSKGVTTIGRLEKNQISVDQDKISREHAEISFHDGGYYLRDLDSANGTFVNNKRLTKEKLLNPGNNIRVGGVTFRFFSEDDSAAKLKIPGYKIEELIGQGGMGRVYRALQISMDRHVAIKVLRHDLAGKKNFVGRFLHEARAAGKLNHPNLIHVNDAGKVGETYYFSMELVSGNDLSQIMAYRDFDHSELFRIAAKVTDALECAHKRGIIHRDIKPENIILTEDGEVKLADLGIAKIFDVEGVEPAQGTPKSVLGTPHYMSPEQASGQEVDCRTDLYSLGATLYHVLCGQPPFEDTTNQAVMRKHIFEEPQPLEELCPRLPQEAVDIVTRLMMKNKEDRFATAAEARDALEKASKISRRPVSSSAMVIPQLSGSDADGLGLDEELGWRDGSTGTSALAQVLLLVGILLISLGASLVLAEYPGEQDEAAQKLLDQGWELEVEGKYRAADEKYSDVLISYAQDNVSYEQARDYRILLAKRRQRLEEERLAGEKEAATARWNKFKTWLKDNPEQHDEWEKHLTQLEAAYADTPFEDLRKLVDESKKELHSKRMLAAIQKQNEAYYAAKRAADEVRSTCKFDEAIGLLNAYNETYPESVRKSDIKYLIEKVETEKSKAFTAEEKAFTEACTRAEEKLAQAKYSEVIPIYEKYLEKAKIAEYRTKAQAEIEAATGNIDRAIDNHMAKNEAAVLTALRSMDTDKAQLLLENEKAVLVGTKYEEKLENRLQSIRLLHEFHQELIAKIEAEGGRETNLTVANYRNGKDLLRIVGANRKGLNLMPQAGVEFGLSWDKIAPAEMVEIYKLYMDPANEKQKRALHVYKLIFEVGRRDTSDTFEE